MGWPNLGLTHRPVVMGTRGVVTSAHPLASLAGMRMLMQGGNAIDAAVATAAALDVCEPYMSGIGGLGYMLVATPGDQRPRVLDYVGLSAATASPDAFASPTELGQGPKSPLVPGAAGGWLTALAEFGRLDPVTVFAPAIEYAEGGVPITIKNQMFFRWSLERGYLAPETLAVFFPGGRVPTPGSVIRQPQLAATYRELAADGQESFYRGALGAKIADSVQRQGGLLTKDDLAAFQPQWIETASTTYRGYDVHCPPPPCAGLQYLQTFDILEGYDLAATGHNSAETIHLVAEAMKLAGADRIAYAARPDAPFDALLDKGYAAERRALIDPRNAKRSEGERFDGRVITPDTIRPGRPELQEATTHFDVVDSEGNAVAVTQSLGAGFGSGVMAGETGIVLNNFGYWFDFDQNSPNAIGPDKKIEMCMAPAMVFRDGHLFLAIGTPGSFGIVETTPQMISNIIDHEYSIQAAIEAPRFRTYEGTTLEVEARIPKSTRDQLLGRGHEVRLIDDWSFLVGGGQGIMVDPESGALMGGADPRRDGYAVGW